MRGEQDHLGIVQSTSVTIALARLETRIEESFFLVLMMSLAKTMPDGLDPKGGELFFLGRCPIEMLVWGLSITDVQFVYIREE